MSWDALLRLWILNLLGTSWQLILFVPIIAATAVLLGKRSAKLRYAIWCLVLLKCAMPAQLALPGAIGGWLIRPLTAWVESAYPPLSLFESASLELGNADDHEAEGAPEAGIADQNFHADRTTYWRRLFWLWLGGFALFWIGIFLNHRRLSQLVERGEEIDEGPLRVLFESLAIKIGLRRPPRLVRVDSQAGPFLFGLFAPTIAIPNRLIDQFETCDFESVLTHELVHAKSRDMLVVWWQAVVQSLYWFHPFVWWANACVRDARESACDEAVLQVGRLRPEQYGETLVRVLTACRGRSPIGAGLAGVFEKGSKLQQRLEEIMRDQVRGRRFGAASWLTLAVLAVILIPMSPGRTEEGKKKAGREAKYPTIVSTSPNVGASDVDPTIREIKVTFDRDMSDGTSWTGGGEFFPPVDKSRQPTWIDKRTCVLPVKLSKGKFYIVGVNSKSFQNFRSTAGVPTPPTVIYFATQGADAKTLDRLRVPEIAKLTPANNATDVESSTKEIQVTFNIPMDEGMSWTGGGAEFPGSSESGKPSWSKDRKTCVLPVVLESGKTYRLGLNSLSHNNFRSESGIPLTPAEYRFSTR